MPYEPKYSTVSEVPLVGPDPYDESDKLDALELAEAQLESDVSDGSEIEPTEVETIHGRAAASYATYVISYGPSHPTSIQAGDFADDGSNRNRFADEMLNIYKRSVNSILDADDDAGQTDHTIVTN